MKRALWPLVAALLAGCAVGDDYRRPSLDLPAGFRSAHDGTDDLPSLGSSDWRAVFTDAGQRALIEAALANNLDLQVAEARVREARAGVVIAGAGLWPNAALALTTSPTPRAEGEALTSSFLAAGVISWEIDLWGRVRRGAEAARGDLAARAAARDGAQVALIAEVASRHFDLVAQRELLVTTERAARIQAESLRLLRRRDAAGISSAAEVRQAEGQLASTEARLPEVRRQVAASENALALLLGRAPGPIDAKAPSASLPAALPAGLPSELVERRPDLREAEQRLLAANARVGEAKALMLPTLSLTGTFGRISASLSDLLGSGTAVASLGPNVAQTLYAGGALAANRDAAIARLDQALLAYRRTALNALREVSDALVAYQSAGEQLDKQAARVAAQREVLRLADKRFAAGVVSYLEVLDAQRQVLAAETDFVNARLARERALVLVYLALGGGWSEPA